MSEVNRRVVARYIEVTSARPMKPEKMEALLQKLRKGAGTSMKMRELLPVLEHLGGWTVEDEPFLKQEGLFGYKDEPTKPRSYANAHPGNVQTVWERAKANEVTTLPPNPKPNVTYYKDVSPITTTDGLSRFTYFAWETHVGTKVTAPDHKSIAVDVSGETFQDAYLANLWDLGRKVRFREWLDKESPFLTQVNAKLGTESYEEEKARTKSLPRTRDNTGTCPCCFGNFKLTARAKKGKDTSVPGMILHGYVRPGTGQIRGNCFGQDWPPFELSPEGTEAWLVQLRRQAEMTLKYIERLERGDMTEVFTPQKVYKKSEMEPRKWAKLLADELDTAKTTASNNKKAISELEHLVSSWKLLPLPKEGDAPFRI